MGLFFLDLRRWLVRLLAEQPPRLPPSSGATHDDPAPCPRCADHRAEVATERGLREQGARELAEAAQAREKAAADLEAKTRELAAMETTLDEVRERHVEAVRKQHAAEIALAATTKLATQPASSLTPVNVDAGPSEDRAEPGEAKRSAPDGRGRRISELERLLSEADDRCERYRHRAEDAERDLEARGDDHARELASIREDMAREREKLQRSLREAEKRARGASQRAVDQPETLGKTPRPREVASRMAEVRWSPGEECFEAIASELERADRTIDVCVFTITDDRLANALLAAHRRGVKVRVLTDNDKAEDEGSDVRRIERGGVPVRVDRTEYHMHHKFAVFDGRRAITGSYNWTRGAARNNEEHIVLTDEPRIVKELARGFQRLWERLAPPAD